MYQDCADCNRVYNDEHCSTVCPHRGIGFCIVCDCVVCVCTEKTARDWERSNNNNNNKEEGDSTCQTPS